MEPRFNVIRTHEQENKQADWTWLKGTDMPKVIPDVTGDGIPDYLNMTGNRTALNGDTFKSGTYKLWVDPGMFSRDGKTLEYLPVRMNEIYYTEINAQSKYSVFVGIPLIGNIEIADFNGDGLMDISFYEYTGKSYDYTKVLLLQIAAE